MREVFKRTYQGGQLSTVMRQLQFPKAVKRQTRKCGREREFERDRERESKRERERERVRDREIERERQRERNVNIYRVIDR